MTFVRNHLGLILPLFAILFALEYLILFDRVVERYEKGLTEQYAVIVVADKGVKPAAIRNASVLVESVEPVDATEILERIRRQISRENVEKIRKVLPLFFSVKLRRYPSKARLERFERELLAVPGVKRVQVFEKVHDKLYGMLLFMKRSFYVFAVLIGLIGALLVMKQMALWQLEHRERMQIMALFGAPVWLRSGVLFRLAVVDALIAVVMVAGSLFYLMEEPYVVSTLRQMGIPPATLLRADDLLWLLAAGLGIALFSALWVVLRFREEL
ncbi:cell division protein FtsX [Hydrogenimonas sp.]